jgi:C1A family cysteine protease
MRAILLFLVFSLCAFALCSAASTPDFSLERTDYDQLFQDWKAFYAKSYSCPEEEQLRFYNFVDSIHRARALNEKHNTPGLHGITKFSDMTKVEFKAKYLMPNNLLDQINANASSLSAEDAIKMTNPRGFAVKSFQGKWAKGLPQGSPNTLYDWGANGYTSPVKNQGGCGSCWAFSATEQIESNWAMKSGLPPPLAPQQIVDCDSQSSGCGGGWPQTAYAYVQGAGGLETEAEYPYTGVDGTCNDGGSKAVQITGYQMVSQNDEGGMYTFVSSGGPLSICLNADNMETYTGNNQILPGSTCNPANVDHCVQITGWLTDANGNPTAWNVRNSWGPDWGNGGYALLQYGVNACNINCNPTVANV